MRKRKESHDGPPAAGTNILFVPSSAEDPTSLGVDDLMGMINEAGASSAPAQPQEIPPSEAKTEIIDAVVAPSVSTRRSATPPSFAPTAVIVPESAMASPVVVKNTLETPAPPPEASLIVNAPAPPPPPPPPGPPRPPPRPCPPPQRLTAPVLASWAQGGHEEPALERNSLLRGDVRRIRGRFGRGNPQLRQHLARWFGRGKHLGFRHSGDHTQGCTRRHAEC